MLVAVVATFVIGLIFTKWLRLQSLLWIAFFFQALVIVWRVLYDSVGGYETASWFEYITYKTSDPGDVPSFLIPLCLTLFELRRKLLVRDDDSYQRSCSGRSCKLVLTSFGFFTLYSIYWGTLYIRCKDTLYDLTLVQNGTGIAIALFLIPINVLGFMLNKQEKERQGDAYLG